MKSYLRVMVLSILLGGMVISCLPAQKGIKTYHVSAGEVLDVIVMSFNDSVKADVARYFKEALPVAQEHTYETLGSMDIQGYTAGNLNAEVIIFGKWSNLQARGDFAEVILDRVPDFHQQRRKIWSHFGLTYYPMKRDLTFTIDPSQYHVTTGLWTDKPAALKDALTHWRALVQQSGGQIHLDLHNGESPLGYRYAPDRLLLVSWENEAAFIAFQEEHGQMLDASILHINQFIHQ